MKLPLWKVMCTIWLADDHITVYKMCCDLYLLIKIFSIRNSITILNLNKDLLHEKPISKPHPSRGLADVCLCNLYELWQQKAMWARSNLQVLQTQEAGISDIHILILTLIFSHQLTQDVRAVLETRCSFKSLHQVTHVSAIFYYYSSKSGKKHQWYIHRADT